MNLTFPCLWDFILFVQYKSKLNKLKVLSYTDFVFNAYKLFMRVPFFLGHPVLAEAIIIFVSLVELS